MRALALVASIVALAAVGCGGGTEASAPPQMPAEPAPEVEGVTIDGKRLALSDFRGRPVFVNVWASW